MTDHVVTHRLRPAFLDLRSWTAERVAFLVGMALFAASPIPFALQAGIGIFFDAEAMTALPALLLAAVALLGGARRVYALAGVATLVPVIFVILFATKGRVIVNPLVGGEFVSQTLLLAGSVIALASGLAVAVRERRGRPMPSSSTGPMPPLSVIKRAVFGRPVLVALAVAALAVGASGAAALASLQVTPSAQSGGLGFAPDAWLTLTMEDVVFTPAQLVVRAGEVTALRIENRDGMLHTFSYEVGGRLYEQEILPRASTTILLRLDERGEVPFWCAPHAVKRGGAYEGMVGTIRVE